MSILDPNHTMDPVITSWISRFAIESAFHFEDFNNDELLEILELKLRHQDLDATPEAKAVAIEVLSRGRNRPNFGNAGEVSPFRCPK